MRGPIGYVVDQQQRCIGFVLARGPRWHEAYDRAEQSLGSFSTAAAAANAVFDDAKNEESAR
jgi:hypothetical protein